MLAGDRGCLLEGWPAVSFGTWAVLGVASSLGEGSARADGVDGWDGVQDVLVLACGVAGICGMRMGWVMLLSCGREQCSPSGSMYGPAWDALCGLGPVALRMGVGALCVPGATSICFLIGSGSTKRSELEALVILVVFY